MPQVIYTEEAKQDLVRFANFLVANEAKEQAKAVVNVILSNVKRLEEFPLIGRLYSIENKDFRELKIKYGSSGYVCLYSFDPITNVILVHAFRHQRELGYSAF
jgi:addiction module RelE/StbE family toxin